jgi:HSP20 family protein
MAHIPVQKQPVGAKPAEKPAAPPAELARAWTHPLQAMRELLHLDPFAWTFPLRPFRGHGSLYVPDFDIKETPEAFVLKADVPGVSAEEISVELAKDRLVVSGHREQEKSKKGETFYAYERAYGSFSRSFSLPEGANPEKIDAELGNGVLTITIAKATPVESKQIPVKPAS